MKSRAENREQWLQRSRSGLIAWLKAPRINQSLRKPYGHKCKEDDVRLLVKALRDIANDDRFLCASAKSKTLAFGIRVNTYLLGCKPGFFSGPERGITKEEWDRITTLVDVLIREFIPDAVVYIEEWDEKEKFELRWEAYIYTK